MRVQARCFDDKGFVRWPPHINLLYPFDEDRGDFSAAAATAHAVCRKFKPFQVRDSQTRPSESVQ